MANKTLNKKVQAKPAASKLGGPVFDSARELWFAGLGVLSVVTQESDKLLEQGNKFFDKLVSEGTRLEKKTFKDAETVVDDIKDDVEARFDIARQQITGNWDGLGNIFDERVLGTLDRLGIPTTKELSKLSGRVQRMSSQAMKNWKELETAFEERVSTVLKNLNVPNADDVGKLTESMQKISSEASANLGSLSENVQKITNDTAANLSKLEKELGVHVSGAVSDLEVATAKEIRILNEGLKDVTGKVSENWDKLETVVEGRVTEALGGLGIPTTDDLSKLSAELQKLSSQVAAMEKQLNAELAPSKLAAEKAPAPTKVVTTK